MSEIPESSKRDVEFMAQVVRALNLGPNDNCPEPLELQLSSLAIRNSYDYALGQLGKRPDGIGIVPPWTERAIRNDIYRQWFISFTVGIQVMHYAMRDFQDIQSI